MSVSENVTRRHGITGAARGAALAATLFLSSASHAGEAAALNPAAADDPGTSAPAGVFEGDTMTGDWGGVRKRWSDAGLDLRASYIAEGWGNTTGGLDTGALYTGLLKFGGDLNFDGLVPWKGLKGSMTWLWLSGDDATAKLVGNSLTISNIAGYSTWRLYEFWLEQAFLAGDRLTVRVGWMGWDSEFSVSNTSGLFLNGTFGWPAYMYQNLPGGGPGYPMTGIGWRFALQATDWLTLRTVFGHGNTESQKDNPNGFGYASYKETGVMWLNEAEARAKPGGLPGRYVLGAWVNSKDIPKPDNPDKLYSSNYGVYAMVDQSLLDTTPQAAPGDQGDQGGTGATSGRGLSWFTRLAWSPGDRSLVGWYVDTGLAWTGLPGRDDDRVGLGVAWEEFSYSQQNALEAAGSKAAGHETAIEATYSIALAKWLQLQPDLQYIIHPGGTGDLANAIVVGARLTATF
jgi:porin